jgi:hypothetical protein
MYFDSFNRKSLSALVMGIMMTLSSCKKDIPPIFKHGNFGKAHAFIAGYESNGTVNVAKYWIDGQEIRLSDGTHYATANSIFVSNNDVYVAGSDSGAVYWKNNAEIRLSGSNASSIFVSGSDVYVGGTDSTNAVYWKNGMEIIMEKTIVANIVDAVVNSIFVSGNDVYAAGYENSNPRVWKNGVPIYFTDDTHGYTGYTHANSIYVSGNDVFVVGTGYFAASPFPELFYWKNGVLVPRKVDNFGERNSIFVSGSDVYIGGMNESPAPPPYIPTAAYWKNDSLTLLPRTEINSAANSIYVSGNHVYLAGYEASETTSAVYWKDGVEISLTDGSHDAYATSIFIK